MAKKGYCECCLALVVAPDTYNHYHDRIYCSAKCQVMNNMFLTFYSNEEIALRNRPILRLKKRGKGHGR